MPLILALRGRRGQVVSEFLHQQGLLSETLPQKTNQSNKKNEFVERNRIFIALNDKLSVILWEKKSTAVLPVLSPSPAW